MLTNEQIEWIEANRMPRDRWLADSNAKPYITELVEAGIMQPASGEFGAPRDKGETLSIFGRALPVLEMISLYMLTPRGREVLAAAKA